MALSSLANWLTILSSFILCDGRTEEGFTGFLIVDFVTPKELWHWASRHQSWTQSIQWWKMWLAWHWETGYFLCMRVYQRALLYDHCSIIEDWWSRSHLLVNIPHTHNLKYSHKCNISLFHNILISYNSSSFSSTAWTDSAVPWLSATYYVLYSDLIDGRHLNGPLCFLTLGVSLVIIQWWNKGILRMTKIKNNFQ